MKREWKWSSKSGKAFFHAGFCQQDAVGAPKPSEAIPLGEGFRLLFARGVDRLWLILLAAATPRMIARARRRKKH